MSSFDIPFALNKLLQTRGFEGDQQLVSNDQSILRMGTWTTPTGSFYTLVGNQPIMAYWTHNTALDSNGNFLPRDEADSCSIFCLCEDNTMRLYGAPTGARHTPPVFTLQSTSNMLTGSITPSQTGGIIGTTTNNSVTAGGVGELITATIATPGTTLTTATPLNVVVAGVSITAGDWDVWGEVCFLPGATTSITQLAAGINTTTNVLPAANAGLIQSTYTAFVPTAIPQCFVTPVKRISIAASTTHYLVAQAAFTVSTMSAFGTIYARRRR